MNGNLATTNLLLGIMAAVSVLEALLIVAVAAACWTLYRRATRLAETVEARHMTPVTAHVVAILDDVREVTTTVKDEVERLERLRFDLQQRARRAIAIARGLRRVVHEFLHAA
jgi:hypothetical protein